MRSRAKKQAREFKAQIQEQGVQGPDPRVLELLDQLRAESIGQDMKMEGG